MYGAQIVVAGAHYPAVSVDWSALYEEHAGEIAGYLAKLVGDRDAARELLQETFVRAIRQERSLRDPGAVRAWLYRTATNLAHNHRRRLAIVRFVELTGRERGAGEAFDAEAEQVQRALRSVGAETAATLLLFYAHGFSRAEIAAMRGVGEEAVKSRLARGRRDFMAAYRRLERGLAR